MELSAGACSACDAVDSEQMVQCDSCDKWYHFTCAGVDEAVANRSWECEKCAINDVTVQEGQLQLGELSGAVEKDVQQRGMCSSYTQKSEQEQQEKENPSAMKSTQSRSRAMKLELQRLEEQRLLDNQYLRRKYEIMGLADYDREEHRKSPDKNQISSFPKIEKKPPKMLTTSQLSARQALGRDLPTFSGNPEEWAVFISNYETSTELCGFTDADNLIRLQQALKGKALRVARHLLLPETVPEVIASLRMIFGRPELIINSLLQKIRAEVPPKADRFESIVSYAISVRQLYSTMKAAGLRDYIDNPLILQELVDKLPPSTRMDWALDGRNQTKRTLEDFSSWMNARAEAASTLTQFPASEWKGERRVGHLHSHQEQQLQTSSKQENQWSCFVCQRNHRLIDCEKFKNLSVAQRKDIVRNHWICELCLRHSSRKKCRENNKCGIDGCGHKHHSLLHENRRSYSNVQTCNAHQQEEDDVLFRIVPVTIQANGKSADIFAFLDSGSSLTLLEQDVADSLELQGEEKPLCLKWTADVGRVEEKSQQVSVKISPLQKSSNKLKQYKLEDVRTVPKLCLPKQSFDGKTAQMKYKHLQGLPLLSYKDVQPQLLIGLQNEYLGVALKIYEGKQHEPIAMQTRLGWLVSGSNCALAGRKKHHLHHHVEVCECEKSLHEEVRAFFTLESHGTGKGFVQSPDEKRALEILQRTTKRIGNRFESGMLWKDSNTIMPNSYLMALKRLQCLERKMLVDPSLKDTLNRQIDNLLQKGYARILSQEELQKMTPRTWYMPTFLVTNANKPGKIRLVWDGAAKTMGVSLNSYLLKGPDQLVALPNVLYSLRSRRIAISGDICEMFHQVRVRNEDQHAQRFLWRFGKADKAPDVLMMEVFTFGASCSPSVAQFVKNMNAQEHSQQYPEAAAAIIKNHYVDDMMISVDTESQAIQLAKDVRYVHSKGGFEIRGWLSNSSSVMTALGTLSQGDKQIETVSNSESATAKVLGIWWRTAEDVLTFSRHLAKVQDEVLKGERIPTKRELLKVLMSVFDPLGFLAHYLVVLKVLLQEVWKSAVDWDEPIPLRLHHQWEEWRQALPHVEDVKIPRCYSDLTAISDVVIQLHVFVDASESAMSAVAYLRISAGGLVDCALVGAKTKVAPRIPMSIPRMELQAATMGVRLAEAIASGHTLKIQRKVFWSDSRTVLSWLKVDPRKYNAFVMFRIGEVLEGSKLAEWRWIKSKDNVADDATKWKKMPTLSSSDRWFTGPDFLSEPEERWPKQLFEIADEPTEDLRPKFLFTHSGCIPADQSVIEFTRFSTWSRLLRTAAWIVRFVDKLKKRVRQVQMSRNGISSEELRQAQNLILRIVQREVYSDEVAVLENGGSLNKTNHLSKCSAYLDGKGLLRMKGRIDNAAYVKYSTRRPVLLPKNHWVTTLIVDHYHKLFHHSCHETVINEVRQRFWIPSLRSQLRAIRRKCPRCQQIRATPSYPEMAPLPMARLAAYTRPFTYVGVDYFGPMMVTRGRQSEKRWGVLFTCMTIRAVHLELAHSLSTDSCIMCVRNFMGRRGTPREFYSDNGTNFKGAERELQEAFSTLDKSAVQEKFTTLETKWVFNPPAAPHMGGCWERLVGSVKKVLQEITHNQGLRDDSLASMLIEAEAIINSRPLTHVSIENNDAEALTPNHFLLGSSDGSKLPGRFDDKDALLRKSWRKCQQLTNCFWKRWVREYLPTLTRRTKWFGYTKPIKVGDVVIIVDEKLQRGCWPKGIVVEVLKASDGQIRRAMVKTAAGVYIRPVVKLAVLDVRKQNDGETTT